MIFPKTRLYGHSGFAYGLLSDFYIEQSQSFSFLFIINGLKTDFSYNNKKNYKSAFYFLEQQIFDTVNLYVRSTCAQRPIS